MKITIGDILRHSVNKNPEKPAIIGDGISFTYSEFNSRVNRLANGLLDGGLKKGDKLGILLMNCYQFIEIIMACAKVGIIMVPVNWRYQPDEIVYVVENSDTTAFLLGEEFIPIMKQTASRIPQVPNNRYWIVGNGTLFEESAGYEELIEKGSDKEPEVAVDPHDIFFIGYTSGTTGNPKGAVILHETDVELALAINLEFNMTDCQVNLIVMPTFHSNSIWNSLGSILNGTTMHIYHLRGFNPEEILMIIEKYKVEVSSMVPTMFNMIFALPEEVRNKYDMSSVKLLLSSSAPISATTKKEILAFFKNVRLYEAYGATETGIVTSLRPEDQMKELGSVGKAAFGKEIKILDPDGNELPRGETGEIYTKGISIFKEYLKNEKGTRAAFRGEWCSVGDMGYITDEGYLYLVDRKNDMIISGGENIYPTEVENAIYEHPAVQYVAVVGVPDDMWGESVKAVVVLKDGTEATESEIIEFCKGKIASYKKPRTVDFVSELPMNLTGKIMRRQVREKYWTGKGKRI
jgi:acyl-CoA synthetase (AMP-forming)/AMP-acid ligase II